MHGVDLMKHFLIRKGRHGSESLIHDWS